MSLPLPVTQLMRPLGSPAAWNSCAAGKQAGPMWERSMAGGGAGWHADWHAGIRPRKGQARERAVEGSAHKLRVCAHGLLSMTHWKCASACMAPKGVRMCAAWHENVSTTLCDE